MAPVMLSVGVGRLVSQQQSVAVGASVVTWSVGVSTQSQMVSSVGTDASVEMVSIGVGCDAGAAASGAAPAVNTATSTAANREWISLADAGPVSGSRGCAPAPVGLSGTNPGPIDDTES